MNCRRELKRLRAAAILVSEILDGGERDPRWAETQELETAALEYGRACRKQSLELTKIAGARANGSTTPRSPRSSVDSIFSNTGKP